jgi:hypothetical protein
MATTTNNGWTTPHDSDPFKDGALAMRTLGNGIDTSAGKTWLPWTTFTPNITNFGVGTGGTSTGAYVLVGKTLHIRVECVLGTSPVIGGSTFNMPAGFTAKSQTTVTFHILDNLSAFYVGLGFISGSTMQLYAANASGTYVGFTAFSPSLPFTWAATDRIGFAFTVEVN